jgi:CDP-paratose 2-epimerase
MDKTFKKTPRAKAGTSVMRSTRRSPARRAPGPTAPASASPSLRRFPGLREKFGVCQWFHYEDYASVDLALKLLRDLRVKHLRTGISWADFLRPGGKAWYDWQMERLKESGLEVLLSIWHTPPSIAEGSACNGPPMRLRDYADFIDLVITEYGDCFHQLELWNEPNNRLKWDFPNFDPQWRKFGEMIGDAAYWAKRRGRSTVLGGMIPVDHHWLKLMEGYGVLEHIDVVAIHGFPGMWFPEHPNWDWHSHWNGWDARLAYVAEHSGGRPVWVTETGVATWDLAERREAKYELQVQAMEEAAAAACDRLYWYSLVDLDPNREAIEGFHVDENEYHMGLVKYDGYRKHAYRHLKQMLASDAER